MKKRNSIHSRLSNFIIIIIIILSIISLLFVSIIVISNTQYGNLFNEMFNYTNLSHYVNSAYAEFENYVQYPSEDRLSAYQASIQNAQKEIANIRASARTEDLYYSAVGLENLLHAFDSNNVDVMENLQQTSFSSIYPALTQSQSLYNYFTLRLSEATKNESSYANQFYGEISFYIKILIFVSIIILFIIFTLILKYMIRISKSISFPLSLLTKYAQKISYGELKTEDITLQGLSEIEILTQSLNAMKHKINEMLDDVKDKAEIHAQLQESRVNNLKMSTHLKTTELKMLQAQINPHFLFNTLSSIGLLAHAKGNEEIVKLINALSEMLRYNLNKIDRPITLQEEINNLNNYIYIQQVRFQNKLDFSLNISSAFLDTPVPCLILQPLVENAIVHGLKPYDYYGEIVVDVYDSSNNETVVSISDSGVGISEEKQEQLMQMNQDLDSFTEKSIGFSNVAARLRSYFASDDCIHICSTESEGTKILIKIKRKES